MTIKNPCIKCKHFCVADRECGHPKNAYESKTENVITGESFSKLKYRKWICSLRFKHGKYSLYRLLGGDLWECGYRGKWFKPIETE